MVNKKENSKKPKVKSNYKLTIFIVGLVHVLVISGFALSLDIREWRKKFSSQWKSFLNEKAEAQEKIKKELHAVKGPLIPVDSFLVNVSGNDGKIANVNMEFEVNNFIVRREIDERKSQIRDIIIILLSNKRYEQFLTRQGKDILKNEIRDTVNSFLTKGRINQIYFKKLALN